jgi:Big-like domain-containing protein
MTTDGATTGIIQQPTGGGTPLAPAPTPAPVSSKLVYPSPTAKPWPIVVANGDSAVSGADTKVIARWGTVPFQVFDKASDVVSVYAFHRNGVEKVEFYVDGLLAATDTESVNGEFSLSIDIASFPDGKHELQAIVYPTHGLTRSLAGVYDVQRSFGGTEWTGEYTLDFFTNAGGSVQVEVVELQPGTYTWGGPDSAIYNGIQAHPDRWFIYRPAPGVTRDQVVINAGVMTFPSGIWNRDFQKIKLENITIQGHAGMMSFFADQTDMLWFDKVVINGPGMLDPSGAEAGAKHQWWTDSQVSNSRAGMARQFVKGCTFTNIGEDVIREGNFVVDVTIDNVDATGTPWHAGVIANPIMHDNRIYSNLKMLNIGAARSWSFRNGTHNAWEHRDVAIINSQAQQKDPTTIAMYCGGKIENLLIRDSQFSGTVIWRIGSSTPAQWQFQPRGPQSVYITNVTQLDGSYLYIPEIYGVNRVD